MVVTDVKTWDVAHVCLWNNQTRGQPDWGTQPDGGRVMKILGRSWTMIE
jgi:hypothetical protein